MSALLSSEGGPSTTYRRDPSRPTVKARSAGGRGESAFGDTVAASLLSCTRHASLVIPRAARCTPRRRTRRFAGPDGGRSALLKRPPADECGEREHVPRRLLVARRQSSQPQHTRCRCAPYTTVLGRPDGPYRTPWCAVVETPLPGTIIQVKMATYRLPR